MARQYALGGLWGVGYLADGEDRDFMLPWSYVAQTSSSLAASVNVTGQSVTASVGDVTVTGVTTFVDVTGNSCAAYVPYATTVRTTFGTLLGQTFLLNQANTTNPFGASAGHVTVAAGDLVYVVFTEQAGLTATAVNDGLGNTYTACNSGTDVGAVTGRAFYSIITTPGTITGENLAVTCSASSNDAVLLGQAFQGPFAAIDANPANVSSDITSPYDGPATGTLTQADELLVAWSNRPDSTNYSSTSPLIQIVQSGTSNVRAVLSYEVLAATTTRTPQWTSASDPAQLLSGATTFKAQGGSSVNVTTNLVTAYVGTVFVPQTVSVNVTGQSVTASVGNESVTTGATQGAWNATDAHGSVTLSNGDKTSSGLFDGYVRSTNYHGSGKYYAEITLDSGTGVLFLGIVTGDYSTPAFTGTAGYIYSSTGTVFDHTASSVASISTYTVGDVLCLALDATTGKIWFRVNGGNWDNNAGHNPATGSGGYSYTAGPDLYAIVIHNTSTQVTINTGLSAFAQAMPSGYTEWYSPNANVSVTTNLATASVGTVTARVDGGASVTTNLMTASAGDVSVTAIRNASTNVTTNLMTASVGDESVTTTSNASVNVTTNLMTASVGGVSVSAGGTVSTTVGGNQVTASVGTVTVQIPVSTTLTTNLMTASVGNESVSIGVDANVTTNLMTASVGTVLAGGFATAIVEVTGQEVTAFTDGGTAAISTIVTVTGQSMTASIGSVAASVPIEVSVTGNQVTVSMNNDVTFVLVNILTVSMDPMTAYLGQAVSPNWGYLPPGTPVETWTEVSSASESWTPVTRSTDTPNNWT